MTVSDLSKVRIAVPGERTTAFLALRLCIGIFDYCVVPFDQISETVGAGKADAGLLIHEGQLTYQDEGFQLVVDLGVWWKEITDGLPLPLGVNAIRRELAPEILAKADRVLRESVDWGLANRENALAHAGKWGRNLNAERTDRFVGMYVNGYTLDYGPKGRKALETLFEKAGQAGLIPSGIHPEFVNP